MNIDLGSLFFNASIETGGGTPSWGTALGQSSPDYKLTYPGAADILIAMDYCYWPLSDSISCKLGKGGKEYKAIASQSIDSKYEITKAAVFYDVYVKVENRLIPVDKPFILLVTRENENTHKGRRTLKYSDSTSIGEFSNKDFYDAVQVQLGGPNVCWFAYAIDAVEQSKLIISIVKVSDTHESYANPETRKRTWMSRLPTSMQASFGTQNSFSFNISPSYIPSQIIYYGVPGCGKSHEIKKKLKNVPDYNKIRTVFHPEYSNADFVGQILPEVNITAEGRSIIEYKFKPGPFTEIVRRAYLNPDENFYLVIEEINRGNAAAIFGEMFQLLDRLDADEKKDEVSSEHIYGKGWSSYGVDNQDVNAYIRNQVVISQEKTKHCSNVTGSAGDLNPRLYKSMDIESENVTVTWREKNENGFTPKSKHIHFSANTAIRLPPNLSIYATMNTSDQNVFTLDNAFQRRWEMKQIPNDLKNTGDSAAQYCRTIKKVKKTESGEETVDTNVQWGDFRKAINEVIMDSAQANGLSSMEDKRLGGWFYTESDNFAEKVLKYLWDDAFKFDRKTQFGEIKTLEDLVKEFNKVGFKVFKADAISKLQRDSLTTPDTPAQNDTSVTNG